MSVLAVNDIKKAMEIVHLRTNKLLPKVAEHADLNFLQAMLADQPRHFKFANKSIVKAIRRANNRPSNDMTIALVPILTGLCRETYIVRVSSTLPRLGHLLTIFNYNCKSDR